MEVTALMKSTFYYLIILVASLLAGFTISNAQTCDHLSDSFQRFEGEMRITVPVKVTSFDGRIIKGIAASIKDKSEKPVEFYIDDRSNVDPGFRTDYKKGKWWFVFSTCDQYAYYVRSLLKKQIE